MISLRRFLHPTGRRRRLSDPLRTAEPAGATFELSWRLLIKRRMGVVLGILACWTLGVEARLVQLQVFRHDELVERARRQQQRVIEPIAKRGDIVDRRGEMLAYSVDAATVIADPTEVKDAERTAAALCEALGECTADKSAAILKNLRKRASFAYVARQVSDARARRVAELKLPGITLVPETHRYYPKFELASHVLGFVGIDNEGLGGVELAYDGTIRGHKGLALVLKDARQNRMLTRVERPPTAGATLELSLDLYLQYIVERELRAGVEEHRADAGSAVVMDPQTGEILALASYPTFNPNRFKEFSDDERRDRAIQDLYEPGSTFKIVTAAAALGEGVWKIDDLVDTSPGRFLIGKRLIDEAKGHNYGVLSFQNVIVKSSNVGAVKIGLRVGADRFSRYVHRFGFGQTLLPDLRGESPGIVWNPAQLNDSGLASMSMGYQVGVTPLQMAAAVSAVANGGSLYQPHVVRAIVQDGRREEIAPKPLRRAIDAETAATVTSIMEEVVLTGTGKKARVDGYQVAGKTGTAEKLVNGNYVHNEYNASFVGFVPSRKPALTIVVVVDTPRANGMFGGDVAAPIFHNIAQAALRHLAVPPTINPTPPIVVAADAAVPADVPPRSSTVIPAFVQVDGRTLMPDVRGLSAREALRVLGTAGLQVRLSGDGLVVTQTPEPGVPVETGGWSSLELHRGGTR